jgi:nucleoside phosphorylase
MAIKVLVLEDDPSKKTKLLKFLQETPELFSRIDTSICADEAERCLSENEYDLFIIDIVVPKQLGGEKHERNSIALLERLDEGVGNAITPKFILPVSSSSELSQSAHDFFLGRPWGILPYNDSDDVALKSIESISKFVSSHQDRSEEIRCDALIITALLEPEFASIEQLSFNWGPYEPLDAQHLMRRGTFDAVGVKRDVIAVFCLRMGPVQASILTSKCLHRLTPKVVIMAGICAGVSGKAEIGDVVAADVSWDWQSGKYVDSDGMESFQIAPHQLDIMESLRTPLILLKKDQRFWESFALTALQAKVQLPKLVVGPMATGSSVLADERVRDRIKVQQHKNVVGLDMETYGVYAAVQACSPNTPVISLKSVCDKGDLQKSDEFQAYAAEVSAKAVAQFLMAHSSGFLT